MTLLRRALRPHLQRMKAPPGLTQSRCRRTAFRRLLRSSTRAPHPTGPRTSSPRSLRRSPRSRISRSASRPPRELSSPISLRRPPPCSRGRTVSRKRITIRSLQRQARRQSHRQAVKPELRRRLPHAWAQHLQKEQQRMKRLQAVMAVLLPLHLPQLLLTAQNLMPPLLSSHPMRAKRRSASAACSLTGSSSTSSLP